MSLRHKIQQTLQLHAGDHEAAAVAICILMDDQLGLYGNGWFDGDELMLAKLEEADGDFDETNNGLFCEVMQAASGGLSPDALRDLFDELELREADRQAVAGHDPSQQDGN